MATCKAPPLRSQHRKRGAGLVLVPEVVRQENPEYSPGIYTPGISNTPKWKGILNHKLLVIWVWGLFQGYVGRFITTSNSCKSMKGIELEWNLFSTASSDFIRTALFVLTSWAWQPEIRKNHGVRALFVTSNRYHWTAISSHLAKGWRIACHRRRRTRFKRGPRNKLEVFFCWLGMVRLLIWQESNGDFLDFACLDAFLPLRKNIFWPSCHLLTCWSNKYLGTYAGNKQEQQIYIM